MPPKVKPMIRVAKPEELSKIMPLYDSAREFMQRSGNSSQWIDGYPSPEIILADIEKGNFYIEEFGGEITGCFAFIIGEEPTYQNIQGEWPDKEPYGTIHRLASSGKRRGLTDRCIAFCKSKIPTLRADTHRDNLPMQCALLRNGFRYCGIINVANGSERLAYHLNKTLSS